MKIRTQFYLLIGGIVVVPILFLSGIYFLQRSRESHAADVPGYEEIVRIAQASVDRAAWEKLAEFIAHRPPSMEFLILGEDNSVLFSSIKHFTAGDVISDEKLLDFVRQTNDSYIYQFDIPIRLNNTGALVMARIARDPNFKPNPFGHYITPLIVLLIVLFLFSASMSVFIALSITRSVTILEESTRRIASGELDLSIDAKGSNEITSLTASLNRMRLALKDEDIRRSRFIMGVSHDLKTPLALIKGYAEAIGDGVAGDPESLARSLGIIGAKVDQLEGMIDDLIDFVRVDTGEWRRGLEQVSIAAFLIAFARRVSADADLLGRRAESKIDVHEDVLVPMDERLVLRALENLVNNALRYTSEGGTVRIASWVESGRNGRKQVAVEISDDGLGIDEADIPYIFDLFYRGSASRREQGMGLGLSVVKGVVDSHGWEISVSSKRGMGSVFRIEIPLKD